MAKIHLLVYYDSPHQKLMLADDSSGPNKCLAHDSSGPSQLNISFRQNQCKVSKRTEVKISFIAADNVKFDRNPIVWEVDHSGHVKGDFEHKPADPTQSPDLKHVTLTYPNVETYNFDLRVKVDGQNKTLDPKIINGIYDSSALLLFFGVALAIISAALALHFFRLNRRKAKTQRVNGRSI